MDKVKETVSSKHNGTKTNVHINSETVWVHRWPAQVPITQNPSTERGKRTRASTPNQKAVCNWSLLPKGKSVFCLGCHWVYPWHSRADPMTGRTDQRKANSVGFCVWRGCFCVFVVPFCFIVSMSVFPFCVGLGWFEREMLWTGMSKGDGENLGIRVGKTWSKDIVHGMFLNKNLRKKPFM